ncbi:MAG: F0F1 ATP synthase subunit gamma [Alphaproteobacteria bacterium]|nr:F0F1 ATP synthase subunit gamma [Alphaproteobacteria bacterium]OJV45511.1 MAG: F0F1 ATP synthase subunit gamma [Alphaproteobacteria bacterium 43-37]
MPSLKDLRDRKKSVESTRKITSAMKMVSAAKLRRAQDQAVAARPFAVAMSSLLQNLMKEKAQLDSAPMLMAGTGKDQTVLLVLMTSDRGLCGGFNTGLVREAKNHIKRFIEEGKHVKVLCIGRKGKDLLKREYAATIIDTVTEIGKPKLSFADARDIAGKISDLFFHGAFDRCVLIYSRFKSAMTQIPTATQLIPFEALSLEEVEVTPSSGADTQALFIYEPDEATLLEALLPKNLEVQIYRALLETFASEQGARMTAMDSATRNAGDMIKRLDLTYNRARQAYITKELIEIISGAEAL